jgi:hypothetical protein
VKRVLKVQLARMVPEVNGDQMAQTEQLVLRDIQDHKEEMVKEVLKV